MVELLRASVLSDGEKDAINRLNGKIRKDRPELDRLDKYYEGEQRLQHLGVAVPPEMRIFETIVNVPRMAVDEPALRQNLKMFYRVGDSTREDEALREAWEYNNLASNSRMQQIDSKIFGRSFVSVGSNEDDAEHPIITVEDPRQIACTVSTRRNAMSDAFRLYRDETTKSTRGVLYLPDSTIHVLRGRNGWEVTDRDDHRLGRVPMVMFPNRSRTSRRDGVSEMKDIIGKTDAIGRLLAVLGLGAETIALPHIFVIGASEKDFVDEEGEPIPAWESYLTAMRALENEKADIKQVSGADLSNFTGAVNEMLAWCATELGLPTRYAGQQTVNPAAEGAIRADEARLVVRVQSKNAMDGDGWSWVMGLEERFRTGDWSDGNAIRTRWHDPGTSTYSQLIDGLVKQRQVSAISIEGMWDEMGWDEARKNLERNRLRAEREADIDPYLSAQLDGAQIPGEIDPAELKARADAFGVLVRSGADPTDAAQRAGLAGLALTGERPVSLRATEGQDGARADAPARG